MKEEKKTKKPTADELIRCSEELKRKKEKTVREAEAFKKRYFDYYDDIKISYREDW